MGLADRSVCKTWLYAYIYGAGNEKLGKVVGGGMSEGKQLRDKFESAFPMIRELKNKITAMIRSNQGNIKAIDGRLLECRSEHSALNGSYKVVILFKTFSLRISHGKREKLMQDQVQMCMMKYNGIKETKPRVCQIINRL